MLRTGRIALALALAGSPLALGACGDDEGGTIPQANADALLAQVATVEQEVESGQCSLAVGAVDRLREGVDGLPKEVGEETKGDLFDLVDRLENLVNTQCEEADTGATGDTGAVAPTTTSTTTSSTTTTETDTETEEPPEQPPGEGGGVPGGENQDGNGGGGDGGDDTSGGTSGG